MQKNSDKKPVLFIGPYPPPYSGPEMGMKLFLESSLRESFDINFLKTNVRKTNEKKGRFDLQMVLAFFRFLIPLVYMIIRYRPLLVYYPITPIQIGWLGRDIWCLFICRLFRVKCVIHLRGGHLKLNLQKFHPLAEALTRKACHSVALALVQANCLKDQFEDLIPEARIKVLYQAIDTSEYDTAGQKDDSVPRILFLGHMTQAKGYCDLVRSIPIIVKRYPGVQFYFAGTLRRGERGVFYDQTNGAPLTYEDPFDVHEAISSGSYKQNYIYLGIVSGQDKIRLLRDSDILVLPSYSEGFSRALLEGMSMGLPIVCTPVGAHKEVVEHEVNGLIVQPGDVGQLAKSILHLLNQPALREKISETNYRYAREKFDIEIIATQMEEYLDGIINESK
jgi:glycosyltransferase involved in cell wall biosynthesis